MGKYLSGSAQTGKKITENDQIFEYDFKNSEIISDCKIMYKFDWRFDSYQFGYINIIVDKNSNCIDESSLINTDKNSPRKFKRPLGLYNDKTMHSVFRMMLQNTDENTLINKSICDKSKKTINIAKP